MRCLSVFCVLFNFYECFVIFIIKIMHLLVKFIPQHFIFIAMWMGLISWYISWWLCYYYIKIILILHMNFVSYNIPELLSSNIYHECSYCMKTGIIWSLPFSFLYSLFLSHLNALRFLVLYLEKYWNWISLSYPWS